LAPCSSAGRTESGGRRCPRTSGPCLWPVCAEIAAKSPPRRRWWETVAQLLLLAPSDHARPGRTRFVAFTPEQIVKISQEGFEMMIEEHAMDTLPPDHGFYRTVVRVANRLLSANRDLAEMQRDWAVTVVADDAHVNAYAMECGNIVCLRECC
ncbi:uncharacterized protein LOC122363790, partial [Amphibalanus amphitrite]|uniref:uncharacterized protein LOC122363790 n=1 Tax=Amphibalanus amphitrite TaxID=1232801 RepID=UPI001C920BE7